MTVRKPSGAEQTVTLAAAEPGLWRATMPADEIGLYRVEQGDKRAFAHVGAANPREFIDARSTAEKLAAAGRRKRADASPAWPTHPAIWTCRGSCRCARRTATAGPDWIGIRMTEASVLKGISRIPLFTGFIALFGIAGLFGLLALVRPALRDVDSRRALVHGVRASAKPNPGTCRRRDGAGDP